MKKQFTYKPEILVEIAQEYLQAEEAFRVFVKKHTPFPGYCNLTNRDDESEYWRLYKGNSCTLDALCSACRMVDADVETVLSTVKAMNRYEKRERWQVCAHLPSGYNWRSYEDRVETLRRFWSVPDSDADCFKSTGRQKPWTVEEKPA